MDRGPLATGMAQWEWNADGTHWSRAVGFPPLRSGIPPHQGEAAATVVEPIGREEELYDFGRELIGQVTFRAAGQPALFVGESMAEARNSDPRHFEQSLKLVVIGKNQWISEHPLAFRYLRIANTEAKNVECRAWGAGPVVLLPRLVLGLRPTADGWKRFVVAPKLGDLEWACATVPTARGDIQVSVENGWIHLRVHLGTVAQCGGNEFAGPREVRISAPGR